MTASAAPRTVARALRTASARVRGVDRASVRVATDPPALSFALDPARNSPQAALATIERTANTPGLALTLLRAAR